MTKCERPDPHKVDAALERASLDTPRQYDDRKTLAYQVTWQTGEIKQLKAEIKQLRKERGRLNSKANKIGKCATCGGTVIFMDDGENLCNCHTDVERTQKVSE